VSETSLCSQCPENFEGILGTKSSLSRCETCLEPEGHYFETTVYSQVS
jgi:hypothetical protein